MNEPQKNPFANLEVKPGDIVGERYEIGRLLGAGGMGSVFEARHMLLGRVVAIKVLRPEIALHPQFAGRFLQEAKAAAELSHKHIVQLTDYGLDGERPYMVMEYLHGESFGALLKREGRLSPERVVAVMDPVLRALSFAHERGVIHRDIKPDNIFLARDDEGEVTPKIVDFGIAKRQDESVQLTSAGAALGTPAYMSPEQVMASKNVTPAADQYAVGTTIYEALTGENPFQADTLNAFIIAKATQSPRPIEALRPDLAPELCAIVMRTLEREPERRFPSLQALRDALASWRGASLSGSTGVGGASMGAPTAQQLRQDATARELQAMEPASPTLPNGTPAGSPAAITPNTFAGAASELSPPRDGRVTLVMIAAVAAVAVATVFALVRPGAPRPAAERTPTAPTAAPTTAPASRVVFSIQATPATATIVLDGQTVGTGRAEIVRPKDGERHQLEIRADGYTPMTEVLVANQDVHVSRVLVAQAAPAPPPPESRPHGRTPTPQAAANAHAPPTQPAQPTQPTPPPQIAAPPPTTAAQATPPTRPATATNHANIDTTNPF